MLKVEKIIILSIILFLFIGLFSQVKATNTLNLNILFNTNTTTEEPTTNTADTNNTTNTTNTVNNTTTGNLIVQPNTNRAGSSGNSLPQTGVTEDITVMFFIVVCIIAAIYAYKKIRDYKA